MLKRIAKRLVIVLLLLLIISAAGKFFYGTINYFRVVFSLGLLIFIPGYLLSFYFFPLPEGSQNKNAGLKSSGNFSEIERILLSFALSMSIVPLMLFFENKLGIRINTASILWTSFSIIFTAIFILVVKKRY